ncbi:cleavage stimulation factor subunit 1 [Eurytemora carolleeae]|uniref:cleavage stimulation factor subunit 1 n=1 Tax=Eurytemora carolleeae TaxID=1294199 RepID=UPI000C77B06D|nr:cleavage stimulation factor subunit 1 [Eurytemora carolleeae]|eukprot:XP_023333349.1 cleavage stimulation factor subunit 1-like [Eurytemora affinis]
MNNFNMNKGIPGIPVATTISTPSHPIPSNIIQTRELLYRLIISQLFYDGYQQVAVTLSNMVHTDPPCPPSDRLMHVVTLGLERESESKHRTQNRAERILGPGLDLEYETEMQSNAPEPAQYETAYVTSHKGNCRSGAFSPDGQLCATGSVDASIKVLDVDRMLAKSNPESRGHLDQTGHPVIRTLYDHLEEVTCLEFHPKEAILASGSNDFTIKLFDYSKASAKKAFRTMTDAAPLTCMSFHPSGDFLVAGSATNILRLYDVNTAQCFISAIPSHHHSAAINSVKWANDGKHFVSGSADGSIKIWDAVSNRCISTFLQAHDGAEVCSVNFSRNGKYVLSSGKDSLVKLWELSTSRCLIAYTGAGTTGKQENLAQAVFNHTEDYVMFPDEATTSLCVWDARNASRKQLLSLGHNAAVRLIVHSPTHAAFLTCSDDFRARFWFRRH